MAERGSFDIKMAPLAGAWHATSAPDIRVRSCGVYKDMRQGARASRHTKLSPDEIPLGHEFAHTR